jgi:hypothetical protein
MITYFCNLWGGQRYRPVRSANVLLWLPALLSRGTVARTSQGDMWWKWNYINPSTASCENTMSLSVPGIVRSSHTLVNWNLNNFWSTEPIFNQFFVFLRTMNALCVCVQYKYPRSIKESSGQTSQSFQSTLSSRINVTSPLSLAVA